MDKILNQSVGKIFHSIPSKPEIDEIVKGIQKIDREIEKFYKIHGAELKDTR